MKIRKIDFILLAIIVILGIALNVRSFSLLDEKNSAQQNQIQRLEIQVEFQHNKIEQLEKNIQWQHDRTTKIVHDLGLENGG